MKNKLILSAAILLLFCAGRVAAQDYQALQGGPTKYLEMSNWSSSYSYGRSRAAVQYNITLKAQDIDAAEKDISKLLEKAGCQKTPQEYYQQNQKTRSIYCIIGKDSADAVSRKVILIGSLQQYNVNRAQPPTTYNAIRARYNELAGEMEANKATVKPMTAVSTVITELLTKYSKYITDYEAADKSASITVAISPETPAAQ